MHLTDAHVYACGQNGSGSDVVLNANDLVLHLPSPTVDPPEYSAVAASTAQLTSSIPPQTLRSSNGACRLPARRCCSACWRTAFPSPAPSTQERQGRDRYPDLRRYYLFYEAARTLGPDWGDSPVPWLWVRGVVAGS